LRIWAAPSESAETHTRSAPADTKAPAKRLCFQANQECLF